MRAARIVPGTQGVRLETILGPIDLKNLQLAFEKLGWTPPDSVAIIACLRGDPRHKGKGLDLAAALREKWVEKLRNAEKLDRKEQEAAYRGLRSDIGEWLDHYTRGEDRPK